MRDQQKWDERFINLALQVASWSKDQSRKVGCIIVGPMGEIRSTGYNGFPRGVDDDLPGRHVRPDKYQWTEHAERNAIYNAARVGTPLECTTIYLPWFPCVDCARAIIQSGIMFVVCVEPDWQDPTYAKDFDVARTMFAEARVAVRFVPGFEAPKQKPITKASEDFIVYLAHKAGMNPGHAVIGNESATVCGRSTAGMDIARGQIYGAVFEQVAKSSVIAGACPECVEALKYRREHK